MIEHNDDAYVMMLLTMPLSPISDGSLSPLSADEFASLGALLEPNTNVKLRQLLGQDVAGLQNMLGVGEEFAYRLCLLLSRQLLLGRLIEDSLNSETEIITPFDRQYPDSLKRRLGIYQCPALFLKGNPDLLGARYIGVTGISGIRTAPELRSGLEKLVVRAAANGFGLITGSEAGVCRLAAGFALENDGRIVCALTGGFDDFTSDAGHAFAIKCGNMAVISPAHPASKPNNALLPLRNRLIFSLSRAGFVITSDGKRSETEAVRKKLCDNLYLLTDPALPLNGALRQKGFTEIEDLGELDIDALSRLWQAPAVEQMSLFS